MTLSQAKDNFALQIHSRNTEGHQYGYRVEVKLKEHGFQTYRNVTTLLWNSDTGAGNRYPRSIFNSSIHATGIGWDSPDVEHLKMAPETEVADTF